MKLLTFLWVHCACLFSVSGIDLGSPACGCATCTEDVLNAIVEHEYWSGTCRDSIEEWIECGYDLNEACRQTAVSYYGECEPCNPDGSCELSASTAPSNAPSDAPSTALSNTPSDSPSDSPSTTPTSSTPCLDSTRDFLVNEELRNCAWVAKEPGVRCGKGKGSIATHCQATCGECGICNDAKKQFLTVTKGLHDCAWVGAKGYQRCIEVGDKFTCRKTCESCNNGSPCLDSTQNFLVNKIPRACAWVAGNPEVKCLKGFSSNHCPVTCGTCDQGCKDSGARFMVDGIGKFKTCKWVGALSTESRCGLIGKDNGLSTCPGKCGFCLS